MKNAGWLWAVFFVLGSVNLRAEILAQHPPMGWNSWDAYGLTLDESAFRENVGVLVGLKSYGWQYAIIDEGWYMADPYGADLTTRNYQLDLYGRLVPAITRFPSADHGVGLRSLSAWVHRQGLKMGIHIVRGVPRAAVASNGTIQGSPFHVADAADSSETCPWDDGNYGVRDNAAGQAYYNSVMRLYAEWGIDYLKVDCISNAPYRESEIRQIATAIKRSGRPMVLSLSPGPTDLSHAADVARSSQMWRISNDIWDGWSFRENFPIGVVTAFDSLARWNSHAKPGAWPDADMLPIGELSPHPGWGEARVSRLTAEETQTTLLLWAIARSPLILGSNLTRLDRNTLALITNRALIDLNQGAWLSHPVEALPTGFKDARVWVATRPGPGPGPGPAVGDCVLALFNTGADPLNVRAEWQALGVPSPSQVVNLISGESLGESRMLSATIASHGSIAYRLH